MKYKGLAKRLLSLMLVLSIVMSFAVPCVSAKESTETELNITKVDGSAISTALMQASAADDCDDSDVLTYADSDTLRVSIVLEEASTIDAGYSPKGIAENADAMAYRSKLERKQDTMASTISARALDGAKLDVQWNLTLAANIISANVKYGQIDKIEKIPGVKKVIIENCYEPAVVSGEERYDPLMVTSTQMTGATAAYAAGYTGAGSRIAVIDTGTAINHQSFAENAYLYSLRQQAEKAEMDYDSYVESLNLLDQNEIMKKLPYLHVGEFGANAGSLYFSAKLPFGYNYAYHNYEVTNEVVGNAHGSHVAGIAAANSYLANGDGTYSSALESVYVQGIAPDAQIITMNVFQSGGGTYDSDYMAALEDAIILDCDSANLSLGSTAPGFGRSNGYEDIFNSLTEHGVVVCIAAGNASYWSEHAVGGSLLYSEDVSFDTVGSPGSYTNSLAVASVDNDGYTSYYLKSGDDIMFYYETLDYGNVSILEIAGEHEYVYIDGYGTTEDWAKIGEALEGKLAICSRGEISFADKSNNAIEAKALATVVYNNDDTGLFGMNLTGIKWVAPCVSITKDDGATIKANSTPVYDEDDSVLYYTGTLTISDDKIHSDYTRGYNTMSSFSSWGVPGTLEMKPEISAPGGNIYSVEGLNKSGTAYVNMSGTSMACPQVSGMAAVAAQYIRENGLEEKTGLAARQLINSLLMSTAEPMTDISSGQYYPVLQQGAGLANVANVIRAKSYITMGADATESYADGKVKVELGDDPDRTGSYSFSFDINNLSDKDAEYEFGAQFFTQGLINEDGTSYLAKTTTPLSVSTTYMVDGTAFVPTSTLDCDLDLDGDTDADDAQMILDYLVGKLTSIDAAKADVDGNGQVATYDAYLILSSLKCDTVTVPANGKCSVTVQVKLTAAAKQALDAGYENGTYIQGYVFANTVADEEGAYDDVTHSIPVLGFYGNWSDPSMYDHGNAVEYFYGNEAGTYTGLQETNALLYKRAGSQSRYWAMGNPYVVEETYPEGKEAIRSDSRLYKYQLSFIRNSGAVALVVTDDDGNYLSILDISELVNPAFYYSGGGYWSNTLQSYTINRSVSALGAEEGDRIHVSIVSIPEYYCKDAAPTEEELKALLDSGVLGDGVTLTSSFTVDDTAPEIKSVTKNEETGALTVTAVDNEYLAYVAVTTPGGRLIKGVVPENTPGEEKEYVLDLSGVSVGEKCYILVGDYAGNESTYAFIYGGEPEDFTGRMFGFTSTANYHGNGQRWVEIDPANVSYTNETNCSGVEQIGSSNIEVLTAEYYNGYVYMAANDGFFYVAPQGEWTAENKVGYYGDTMDRVCGMAYNYADDRMYVVDDKNGVYTMDLKTGALELQYTVTLDLNMEDQDKWEDYRYLRCLAIDDEGTFYGLNRGSYGLTRLFQWSNGDLNEDGSMDVIVGKVARPTWDPAFAVLTDDTAQGLAWDHDTDELYLANSFDKINNEFYLTRVDPRTGFCYNVAGTDAPTPILGCAIRGLYIVPKEEVTPSGSTETATSILVQPDAMSVSKGTTTQLAVSVFPWNLRDQSVTWRSSDPNTVSVDASGTITAKELGSAVITATTVSEPHLEGSCTVTVTEVPSVNLNALLYQADGTAQWVEFNTAAPESYTAISECGEAFVAGAMVGSNLWMQDAYGDLYKVQPDFFDEELDSELGSFAAADYAPIPSYDGLILLSDSGTLLSKLIPSTHQLGYLDLTATFEDDPMATVAYWKTTGGGSGFFVTPKTDYFYMLSESGKLYTFSYTKNFFTETLTAPVLVADIGFQQTDVSLMNGQYGSMIYVAECNSLFVVSYLDGESARLYQINMNNYRVTDLGDFGKGNYPAVALYQYDRNNAMRVTMSSTYEALFIGETTDLTATVFPAEQNNVTWESSDESVATVNESGRVTGISAGTVTITATTVGVDGDGNHAFAEATVYVKSDNYQTTGTVGAMVKTDDGEAQWIEIDLATLETTKLADSDVYFTGGGRFGDKLYGSDYSFTYEDENEVFHIYSVDPENEYALYQGIQARSNYAMLDMTLVPKTEFQINGYDFSYGGVPSYLSSEIALVQMIDMDKGVAMRHGGYYFFNTTFGAMAFKEVTFDEAGVPTYYHYVLTCRGDLYLSSMTLDERDGQLVAGLRCEPLLNIGITFGDNEGSMSMYDAAKMSMTNIDGNLIISNTANGVVTLYYVDTDNLEAGAERIGVVEGVSAMSSLYSDMDATLTEVVYDPEAETTEGEMQNTVIYSADEPVVEMVVAKEMGVTAPVNEVTGATNAVSAEAMKLSGESASRGELVRVALTETVDTTNGLISVQYDPAELEFVGIDTGATSKAWNTDDSKGEISFAYASVQPIAAGDSIAALIFRARKAYTNTTVTVRTVERNQDAQISEDAVVISVSASTPATPEPDVTPVIPVLPEPESSFVDVPANEYYYDAVQWAVENGITTGTSATTFSPDDACTRAQVVTFLWRAAGCPAVTNGTNPFTDVSEDSYCYDAVLWAAEKGITTGTSATTFSPDAVCTRAQIVTFLWRAAGCPGAANGANPFTDMKSGDYYYDAVLWAVTQGITTGTSASTFTPDAVCTRAQVVTFLYRS